MRKSKKAWTVLIKFVKTTKVSIRHHALITQLKEDNDRQPKLKENYTLQQATNLESGSIRKVKQTVIIT